VGHNIIKHDDSTGGWAGGLPGVCGYRKAGAAWTPPLTKKNTNTMLVFFFSFQPLTYGQGLSPPHERLIEGFAKSVCLIG
jgi:hypothetical protein